MEDILSLCVSLNIDLLVIMWLKMWYATLLDAWHIQTDFMEKANAQPTIRVMFY